MTFFLIMGHITKCFICLHSISRSITYMEEERQITKEKYAADISSIKESHARIKSLVLKTPLLSSSSLNAISGRQLYFKCENFQKGWDFFIFYELHKYLDYFFTFWDYIILFLLYSMAISGAFKFRGACNAVFSLNDEDASKGVITHSRFVMCRNSSICFF